jgi:30S ribosomal protein 3
LKFKLNVLWLENELGIAIDQIQSGEQIPLTDYFFWPKIDTWYQIKRELETKPWISKEEKAKLLNSTATIMNQWQDSVAA